MFAFFLIVLSIVPLIMIIFGAIFQKKPPTKINYVYGYRSKWSMKSEETWIFAHKYVGKLWLRIGILMGILPVIVLSIFSSYGTEKLGHVFYIASMGQIAVMILTILPTELNLRRKFNEEGIKKIKD